MIDKKGEFTYFGHKDDKEFHQALDKVVAEKSVNKPLNNPVFVANALGYKLGDTVTNMSLSTIDSQAINLKFNMPSSKKVAMVFFGPWCEWYLEKTEPKTSKACTKVREILEQQPKESNLQWLTVSTNLWSSLTDLQDYRKSYGTTMPIIFDQDSDLFTQFGVNQIPTIILIEPDGTISLKSSIHDADFDAALHAISTL